MKKTSHRNRSAGWKHAKLTGHLNEEALPDLLTADRLGLKSGAKIRSIEVGGLNEKKVPTVFEDEDTKDKTLGKADLRITLEDQSHIGVSVKKSLAGQVFLISAPRFIRGFELQYGLEIPSKVKRAMGLFWGSESDVTSIIKKYGDPKYRKYELRKHRLTLSTLKNYDEDLATELLAWFQDNIAHITDFCFAKGLAASPDSFASMIWYKNTLGENSTDALFSIDQLCALCKDHSDSIFYGNRNGGTVIWLPFGFVEWHQGKMQFHHKHQLISDLFLSGPSASA